MPIEIKITDILHLSMHEINTLTQYLINSAFPSCDVLNTEKPKAKRKQKANSDHTVIKILDVPVATDYLSGEVVTLAVKTTDTAIEQLTKDVEADAAPSTPSPPLEVKEPPQYDLVQYVVEHTRTKKLTFDSVMAVLQRFGVINLNSLSDTPQFIEPIFQALKEIVNE
jgi:hypothetical protein